MAQTRSRPAKVSNALDTLEPPGPPYYLEMLDDGLTLDGAVWRRGSVCMTDDPVGALTVHDQVAKWGRPMFQQISEATYRELADSTVPRGSVTAAARLRMAPPMTAVATPPRLGGEGTTETAVRGSQGGDVESHRKAVETGLIPADTPPWPDYATLSVEDTLERIGTLDDDSFMAFAEYERTHLARPQILAELGL